MRTTVRRMMQYQLYQSGAIERKLEKLARKGLFLEQIGAVFWKFRKGEPKKVNYAVTYFAEASIFQSVPTENQQTYIEYAREAGWNLAAQNNQMQVFMSEEEHVVPFETDEREKLLNIKKNMRKSFLPSTIILILVFLLNLFTQYQSYESRATEYLSNNFALYPFVVGIPGILYLSYLLFAYFIWCKKSERSIHMGGGCIDKRGQCESIIDLIVPGYLVVVTGLLLLDFMAVSHAILVLLLLLQMPFLYLVFGTSVKWMKKKKKSATTNKVVSYSLLVGASLVYMAVMMGIVLHSDWIYREGSPYRTVMWELTPTESHEYRLYSDTLPLTCEDLYGASDYDYYSYEKNRENSLFLTSTQYRQFALPAYDAPPSIEYTIIEPKFDFVYDIVEKELKTTRDWSERSIEPMDNIIFGTEQAYQTYYDKDAIGEYLLFYQDKIIVMNVEEPVTEEQRTILIEKLKLGSR